MSELERIDVELDPECWTTGNLIRTPGCHLTDIIKDFQATLGVEMKHAEFTSAQSRAFWLQGYLWEDVMTETIRNRVRRSDGTALGIGIGDYIRLPEIATDGKDAFFVEYDAAGKLTREIPKSYVLMTPDGMRLAPERLLEIKWTTKSVKMSPERDRPDWFIQVPCYLVGLSLALSTEILEAEWHVQFPCGDWRGSGVKYQQWHKRYAWRQLMDKWDQVYAHARVRGMIGG